MESSETLTPSSKVAFMKVEFSLIFLCIKIVSALTCLLTNQCSQWVKSNDSRLQKTLEIELSGGGSYITGTHSLSIAYQPQKY